MSTDTVSPPRRRMIEDMNARKLCAGTQRGHLRGCKRFAAVLRRSPETATAEIYAGSSCTSPRALPLASSHRSARSPPQIRAPNAQLAPAKSKPRNFIDLKPPPGPLPVNPRGTLHPPKSP
jgi:hypothetical protein